MEKIIAFFKPPDPKQLAKQWQSNIRKEQRRIDANINEIKRECMKTTREIKTCLKRQDVQLCASFSERNRESEENDGEFIRNKGEL